MKPTPPPRLHLLQAPRAHTAVILRRGPAKWVEVVRWDMRHDIFERGHWFHGRLHERRCDLSPDGEMLVYFASKFTGRTVKDREYTYAWTAVSRVPWLTALALWPKGDTWGGGGLFTGDRALRLNHRVEQSTPHPKHKPRGLEVTPVAGVDDGHDLVYPARLTRDGWALVQERVTERRPAPEFFVTRVPELRSREHPSRGFRVELERRIDGLHYRERFRVVARTGEAPLPAGRVDWVDWDSTGRLVVLVDGRIEIARVGGRSIGPYRTLVDLGADRPEPRVPPERATRW